MVLFKIVYYQKFSAGEIGELIKKFIVQNRMWPIWFLTCLFCLNLFFYAVVKVLKTDQKIAVFSILSVAVGWSYYKAGGATLPWNADICFMVMPFFFAGYFYKEHHAVLDAYLADKKRLMVCFLVMESIQLVSGYFTLQISGKVLNLFYDSYGFLPLTYLAAFAGIAATVCLAKMATLRPICYIGEQSLIYFAWHQTIFIPLVKDLLGKLHIIISASSGMAVSVTYKILQCLLLLLILTGCNMVITNTKLKVMLGK